MIVWLPRSRAGVGQRACREVRGHGRGPCTLSESKRASVCSVWAEMPDDPRWHVVRGRVGKSDEVKTTDSVIIHLIWPIEELDIRSMSL